ncbi:NAD(P)H-dependent glycerol-3-phosphate dehydrogenase [Turicimonas muris]|uniref:NAD(P)H-dependent glycerol-3-phosphate dehydrogenase n=3 Tax=Turicimonas muris TaxID=1796652 RepID=UPI001C3EF8AF|nr:NAD(P)H-dependent glycerol-3-phosphate dehydrogenase [Turicimonas muris]
MLKITVIGAGSWGTALAVILSKAENQVKVLSLTKRNLISLRSGYHPNFEGLLLPKEVEFTQSVEDSLVNADIVIFAVSSKYLRPSIEVVKPFIKESQLLISVIKGLEPLTLLVPSQIIQEAFPHNSVAVLSGPSHAEEVIKGEPFGMQLASVDLRAVELIRKAFNKANVYLPATDDLIGTQLGGALKNIIAIGYGIALEQGLGTNFYSMLVTAGMADLRNLAVAGGAAPETLMGLGGLGDLITTIGSPYSRNRKFGQLLGSGISVEKALQQVGMVVEGVNAMEGALELAQEKQVSIPVINFINNIIKKRISPTKMKGLVQLLKGTY